VYQTQIDVSRLSPLTTRQRVHDARLRQRLHRAIVRDRPGRPTRKCRASLAPQPSDSHTWLTRAGRRPRAQTGMRRTHLPMFSPSDRTPPHLPRPMYSLPLLPLFYLRFVRSPHAGFRHAPESARSARRVQEGGQGGSESVEREVDALPPGRGDGQGARATYPGETTFVAPFLGNTTS